MKVYGAAPENPISTQHLQKYLTTYFSQYFLSGPFDMLEYMLIEYRVLGVEFRNCKLLSSFPGILKGLLGLQHLYTFPGGLERERG